MDKRCPNCKSRNARLRRNWHTLASILRCRRCNSVFGDIPTRACPRCSSHRARLRYQWYRWARSLRCLDCNEAYGGGYEPATVEATAPPPIPTFLPPLQGESAPIEAADEAAFLQSAYHTPVSRGEPVPAGPAAEIATPQPPNPTAVSECETVKAENPHSEEQPLVADWLKEAGPVKWLLPGDFLNEVRFREDENFTCTRTTTDFLIMTERESVKTMKIRQIPQHSTDLQYEPPVFKSEKIRILDQTTSQTVACRQCSGRGQVQCSRCNGLGEVQCGSCAGRQVIQTDQGPRGCTNCLGGLVGCPRCKRARVLSCSACDAQGYGMTARVVERKFTHRVEVVHQVPGLVENEFKNGLKAKDFSQMTGTPLIIDEYVTPDRSGVIRQRVNVERFEVHSCAFNYKDNQFHLNSVSGGGGGGAKSSPHGCHSPRRK